MNEWEGVNGYDLIVAELARRSVFDATFFRDRQEHVADIIVRERLDWRSAYDLKWVLYQHWQIETERQNVKPGMKGKR